MWTATVPTARLPFAALQGAGGAAPTATDCALLEAFQRVGAVVLRLSDADADVLRRAADAALAFHTETPLYLRRAARAFVAELPADAAAAACAPGPARGLAGYNEPSPAKAVFRVRRGQLQPWPAGDDEGAFDGAAFRAATEAALALLEAAMDACLAALDRATGGRWQLAAQFSTAADAWDDARSQSLSPFDYFYYYNDSAAAAHVNCHEHVDPGILTAVPCAATPGLELALPAGGDGAAVWWPAEARAALGGDADLRIYQDVVVFANATLATLTGGQLPAVVHRVSKADRPRLSLVYERRPSAAWHAKPAPG